MLSGHGVAAAVLLAVVVTLAGCVDGGERGEPHSGQSKAVIEQPPAYEASTEVTLEYDAAGEVVVMTKPAREQCFWLQMWSPNVSEWVTISFFGDNGAFVGMFEGVFDSDPLADPVVNPGCDDEERVAARQLTISFVDPWPGWYRVWWIEGDEYSGPFQVTE